MSENTNSNTIMAGMGVFELPPLILHPFSSVDENALLLESSRASLALQGFAPRLEGTTVEELERRLAAGRYAELRMLFYIGKDISRWAEQCAEAARTSGLFSKRRIRPETFAISLVEFIPGSVRTKLDAWGVIDFQPLFRRAFGLHAVFQDLPSPDLLSLDFLKRYHRFLDQAYEQRLRDFVFDRPEPGEFNFDLYASGEYSSMLEKSWAADSPAVC